MENLLTLLRRRFVGFSLVGLAILVIGLALLTVLIEVLGVDKILAGILTTTFSVVTNFLANKYLNWKDRPGDFWGQLLRFLTARALLIIANQLFYTVGVLLGIHYLIITLVGTAVVTVVNYFGNDRFVFQAKAQPQEVDNEFDSKDQSSTLGLGSGPRGR